MIFGSISYLNLLPFQIYLKQSRGSTQWKQIIRWKREVPSKINKELKRGRIDAAFISSIYSAKYECTDLGIVADGEVLSVLLIPGRKMRDRESASSNILAEVLGLEGEVLIGDKALRYYLKKDDAIDLSMEWKRRVGLPFVFARLCYGRGGKKSCKMAKEFAKKEWKIPQYILKKEAKAKGVTPSELRWYLEHIYYKIGWREKRALKLFLKRAKRLR